MINFVNSVSFKEGAEIGCLDTGGGDHTARRDHLQGDGEALHLHINPDKAKKDQGTS